MLAYTAPAATTIGVFNWGPSALRVRIGSSAVVGDARDAAAEEMGSKQRVQFNLASGDKVFLDASAETTANVWVD